MDYFQLMKEWEAAMPGREIIAGVRVHTVSDLLSYREEPSPFQEGMRFGAWIFSLQDLTLTHEDTDYEIDLEELNTAADILDTLLQVGEKTWCSFEAAGQLMQAIAYLLDPQANVCSFGEEQPFNASEY